MDGDGDLDVLGAAAYADDITWWENDGSQSFSKHTIAADFDYASSVYAADVDGDGDLDVLGAASFADDITWWENDGSQNFSEHTIEGNFDYAMSVYAADVDGDGDMDVLGAARDADDITWWENDGSQSFSKHTIAGNFRGATSVYAADVDGDGDLDVLGTAYADSEITWWENDGSQSFTEHTIDGNFRDAWSVYAADVDGDGDLDVLGTADWADDITIWYNIAPEVALLGNGTEISNGDTTPDSVDDTFFGILAVGETVTHTFTISSNGSYSTDDLILNGSPAIALTDGSPFTVTQPISTTLSPGQSATFDLTFAPQSEGLFTDTVTILNNDPNENPYTFVVGGSDCDNPQVINDDASGFGSLLYAITNACDGATITFADNYTITLTNTLSIDKELTIDGSGKDITISGNNSVQVFNIGANGVVTLSQLSIINGSDAVDGGGILNSGILTVLDSALQYNQAGDDGGAISNLGTLTIQRTLIYSNTAVDDGGGIFTLGSATDASSTLTIINSTISHNDGYGGVHQSNYGNNTTTITNSTIISNTGGSNRGLVNLLSSDPMLVYNSIVAYHATNCSNVTSGGYNLEDQNDCGFSGTGDQINTDPLLGNLGDYGGETQTYALLPGSAAIDAIPNSTNGCGGDIDEDQRAISRPQNSSCDVGAFESQGFTLIDSGGSNQTAYPDTTFAEPLTITVAAVVAVEPIDGGIISFSAPGSEASLATPSFALTLDSGGAVSTSVTANSIVGSYQVTATATGLDTSALFSLTNACGDPVVSNNNDSGSGSLRQAISDACAGETITFDADYTITLSTELTIDKELTIDGSGRNITVSGNDSVRVLFIESSGAATLSYLNIVSGSASSGAGIYNDGGALTVLDSTIQHNNATLSDGGGIRNRGGNLTLQRSLVYNNTAVDAGGGIYIESSSSVVTIINSTLSHNYATGEGGGLAQNNSGSTTFITNSTIVSNTSDTGRIIVNMSGSLTLYSSLLAYQDDNCNGTITSGGYNLDDDGSCGISGTGDLSNVDPLLSALGDYGGETLSHALLPGSPAIDAIANGTNGCGSDIDEDQRAISRPQNSSCDVGAFESQGFTLTASGGSNQTAYIDTAFAEPLTVTVTAVNAVEPLAGGAISFSAPGSGVSLATPSFTTTLDSSGAVSTIVTANSSKGSYQVTAVAAGLDTSALFSLTNTCDDQVVTNNNDSGTGSLRQAISDACDGGAITFTDDITITLSSALTISREVTLDGSGWNVLIDGDGSVQVFNIEASGVVTLSYLTVLNGSATNGGGIGNYGTLTLIGVSLLDNAATSSQPDGRGGAIDNQGSLTVINSTISGNSAASGGGIFNGATTVTITHSTIVSNSASSNGGGVFIAGGPPPTFDAGYLYLTNSILAYNSGGDCALGGGGVMSLNLNNLIEDGSCSHTGLTGDPEIDVLADNGGESQTFALLSSSPAIDAGDNASCESTDQRGENRNDWACDIGAFELQFTDSDTVSKTVTAGNSYTFGPTLARVEVADDGGCLTNLSIQRTETNHLNATAGIQTGRFWTITPLGCSSGFTVTVTLPYTVTPSANDKACRYTGSGWDCGEAVDNSVETTGPTVMPNIVVRSGVTEFSDWAVGGSVGPTAVSLQSFSAAPQQISVVVLLVLMMGAGTAVFWFSWRRKSGK